MNVIRLTHFKVAHVADVVMIALGTACTFGALWMWHNMHFAMCTAHCLSFKTLALPH